MIHSGFSSKVLGARQWFSKYILEGESSYMPAFVSLSSVTIIMLFFFLLIIRNFTRVFLSNSHLHLKKSVVI